VRGGAIVSLALWSHNLPRALASLESFPHQLKLGKLDELIGGGLGLFDLDILFLGFVTGLNLPFA